MRLVLGVAISLMAVSPSHAGRRLERVKSLARAAGLRLVPTRVTKAPDGTVVLTRYGAHDGKFTEIERISSTPTLTVRDVLKTSIVDGDKRDMRVRELTDQDGLRHTFTRRGAEDETMDTGTGEFKRLSYRRAIATAVAESPITKTAALSLVTAAAASLNGPLVEKMLFGLQSSDALRQATLWAAERGAMIGGAVGAAITLGTPRTSQTQIVTHYPEVVTPARTEIEER